METVDRIRPKRVKVIVIFDSEVEHTSANAREPVNMSPDEEDIVNRIYTLVGERWDLIAGRVPGRTAEEIKRFWVTKHCNSKGSGEN